MIFGTASLLFLTLSEVVDLIEASLSECVLCMIYDEWELNLVWALLANFTFSDESEYKIMLFQYSRGSSLLTRTWIEPSMHSMTPVSSIL
jgi:hypothetical protein